jgi:hypothetical protein
MVDRNTGVTYSRWPLGPGKLIVAVVITVPVTIILPFVLTMERYLGLK